MKRILYTSLFCMTIFALFSYSNGTFTADYTGTTGLGQSCAQIGCHEGIGSFGVDTSKLLVKVLDAANNDVNSYTLNQQYTVEIKFKLGGATKVGLQCTNLFMFAATKAGSIANSIMPSNLQVYTDGSGREYISHTVAGSGAAVISGGYATWKYKWTAPAVATNAIMFNCTVNRSNNDNTQSGDSIFLSTTKILQLPTGVPTVSNPDNITVYPNPANSMLYIRSYFADIDEVCVTDLSGRVHLQKKYSANTPIDISTLAKGNYMLTLKSKNTRYSKLFTKAD